MNCDPRKWYKSSVKKVQGSTIAAVTAAAVAINSLFDFLNMIIHEGLRLRRKKSTVGDTRLYYFDSLTGSHSS
jgi:hypothetical protein